MSLARRHQARVLASQGGHVIAAFGLTPGMVGATGFAPANDAAPEAAYVGAQADAYRLHMASIVADMAKLKQVQSLERKIELKRSMLPEYAPWIEGALQAERDSGRGVQDDVLVTVMIWRLDVGDFAGALPLAAYMLRHHLKLPARFERTPDTLIVELYADGALAELKAGRPAPFEVLADVIELTDDRDMPDEVKARMHKALGLELARRADDPEAAARFAAGARGLQAAAVQHLKRGLELHDKVGVKGDLQKLERALAAGAEGAA